MPVSGPKHGTWIYFDAINRGHVKVGKADKTKRRESQHARTVAGPVEVIHICSVRGTPVNETFVKRYFSHLAVDYSNEVFRPAAELTDYIRWLRSRWFVAVDDISKSERDGLPMMPFTEWQPEPERRISQASATLPLFAGCGDLLDEFPPRQLTADDYYTNERVIEVARTVMGSIDLDPATHAFANKVVKATTIFTVELNGLEREWAGRVWLNPPFSQWAQWVPKIIDEWRSGRVVEMCVLSAMRTVTAKYFAPLLHEATAMCIIKGRIPFWGDKAGDSPDDGHAVFYFGSAPNKFTKHFSELGCVFLTTGKES